MNRRQLILGSAAFAALKVLPASAVEIGPESLAMTYLQEGRYTKLMTFLIERWDPEAPRIPRIETGEVKYWGGEPYPVVRNVEPTDPEWYTMYWQWRIIRTASMSGALTIIAEQEAKELFSEWCQLAKRKVL